MQVEKHSTWAPHTHTHTHTHTENREREKDSAADMSQSLCLNSQRSLFIYQARQIFLSAPTLALTPVVKPATPSSALSPLLYGAATEQKSWISVLQKKKKKQERAAFRHVGLIRNLTFSLVCRWNLSHIYQTRPVSSSLPPPNTHPPSGCRPYQKWLAHRHIYHTYRHHHHSATHRGNPTQPNTHTDRHTHTHLSYITTYDTLHSW